MQNSTRISLLLAAAFSAVFILGMIIGPRFSKENSSKTNGSFLPFGLGGRGDKLDRILKLVETKYVDIVDQDSLQDITIEQLLKYLDPHSSYLPPADAKILSQDLEGNFDGIGIEYFLLNDTLFITSVNTDGPAAKSGLKPGDRILSINGKKLFGPGISNKDVVANIRGRKGTVVNLRVKKAATNKLSNVSVIRDRITVSSVDASLMLSGKIGYIKISRFGAKTDADFSISVNKLRKAGMTSLILDLRQNGGGYLNAATELSDEFLADNKLITYTEGAHEKRTDYRATKEGDFEAGELVVLIDERSASASEIVAGAIQDQDRGTIIGRRSFGKGLVQQQVDFGDGSALNLTVARYFTPAGRSIQKPYKNGYEEYNNELNNRFANGEALSEAAFKDSLKKKQSFKTRKGRLVYGGGGIQPDIFVPIDTSFYTEFYTAVYTKGVVNSFVYNKLVQKNVPRTVERFLQSYEITGADFQNFIDMASAADIKIAQNEVEKSRKELTKEMKALVGRYLFGQETYFNVELGGDPTVKVALKHLTK